ncbi:heme exporter protein CcmD [Phenylobacterium sp.]|uniref:heme exporter protein CcmD n=1 Tax=Phenylobacterium sp. TaxID=1871053 RepID=UPI002737D8CC|nr:heme exporter protein CcmD [Phenylobacterium sp.]MDP3866939.1 heme exporter protein CcmD [Phenylobacterium sp.]
MLDLDPGPYAVYIWPAYGLTVLVFILMIAGSVNRARRWRRKAEAFSKDREA